MELTDVSSPVVSVPYAAPPEGLSWPKPTQKAIDTYLAAWETYDQAVVDHQAAWADLEAADAADARLLVAAVRAGDPDPGTPNHGAAERAVAYSSEAVRQQYAALSGPQRAMMAAIRADPGDVIAQAIAIERAHAEAAADAFRRAAEPITEANAAARQFGSTITELCNSFGLGPWGSLHLTLGPARAAWDGPDLDAADRQLAYLDTTNTPAAPPV